MTLLKKEFQKFMTIVCSILNVATIPIENYPLH